MNILSLSQVDSIQHFDGETEKLGKAEQFFQLLIQLPSYKTIIEGLLLKGDFSSQLSTIRPNIISLNTACRRLIDNKSLKSFLRFVLHAGNFINKVSLLYQMLKKMYQFWYFVL